MSTDDRISAALASIAEQEKTAEEQAELRSRHEKASRQARKKADELKAELIGLYQRQAQERPAPKK